MKLNEFESKLATVSDAKLRQMLAAGRASGPEVAVTMILSECNRRGMDGLEEQADAKPSATDALASTAPGVPSAYAPQFRVPGSETTAYAQEQAGFAGADAPPRADSFRTGSFADGDSDASEEMAPLDAPPATAPDWLNEETRSGMSPMVKLLLVLIALGVVLGLVWKFSR
ncbi:MAG: hypothetical protein ABI036_02690 [Fibrobacteria bacterium]